MLRLVHVGVKPGGTYATTSERHAAWAAGIPQYRVFCGEMTVGTIQSRTALRSILEWAVLHQAELQANWDRMTSRQALAFIRKHGVVLEAAQGPVVSLAEVIAGEPVRGNWWSHPKSHEIFAVTRAIRDSHDVLVCRLVRGKVTFVHRRLWPALVLAAGRLPSDHLSRVREIHTSSGRHMTKEVPFPDWVPSSVLAAARSLPEEAALAEFAAWIE
jgi:hypothetical protein